ncbi:MAG: hypothetical protein M3N29_08985 [Chloroflexota bacterium]|nr:hypothetical protein [Chloroflexota bacterium]
MDDVKAQGGVVSRAWFRLTASGAIYSLMALIGLGLLVVAAWVLWWVAGLVALGLALFFLGVYGPAA